MESNARHTRHAFLDIFHAADEREVAAGVTGVPEVHSALGVEQGGLTDGGREAAEDNSGEHLRRTKDGCCICRRSVKESTDEL